MLQRATIKKLLQTCEASLAFNNTQTFNNAHIKLKKMPLDSEWKKTSMGLNEQASAKSDYERARRVQFLCKMQLWSLKIANNTLGFNIKIAIKSHNVQAIMVIVNEQSERSFYQ